MANNAIKIVQFVIKKTARNARTYNPAAYLADRIINTTWTRVCVNLYIKHALTKRRAPDADTRANFLHSKMSK